MGLLVFLVVRALFGIGNDVPLVRDTLLAAVHPEDRDAINRVQDGIQKWGKLILVYKPQEADIILAVQSRPSEDVLAVYQAHGGDAGSGPSQTYLWRVMGRGGLQKGEAPLLTQFETAFAKIAK